MLYIVLRVIFYPLFWALSCLYKRSDKKLIIQTAKIGDYINATICISALGRCDVMISKVNETFAKKDERVGQYFIYDDYKKSLFSKLKLAFSLLKNRYETIYVLTSSSQNLFITALAMPQQKKMLYTYATKWYEDILGFGFKKCEHTREDLTLRSYLRLVDVEPDLQKYKKSPFEPLYAPQKKLIDGGGFKIGISIGAGNKIKNIPADVWAEILEICDFENTIFFVFGLSSDESLLEELLKIFKPKNARIVSLLGRLELDEAPYHLSLLDLHISSDSGNAYIADCYSVPLILFEGPCYLPEQKPIGEKIYIVKSNAPCVPFSYIFQAPYKLLCGGLYGITERQKSEIEFFIKEIYRAR